MARPFPNIHPLEPVEVSRFQKNIDEKLTDFRVDAGEASELVQLWSRDTYSPAQATELRRAVDVSAARFDRGARRIVRDFLANQLPKLTLPLGGGLPATSARLTWTPPVAHVDGTPANDLNGYVVSYGLSPGNYTESVTIQDRGAVSMQVDNLQSGTWYFAVRAVTTSGDMSAYSNEVFKTVP